MDIPWLAEGEAPKENKVNTPDSAKRIFALPTAPKRVEESPERVEEVRARARTAAADAAALRGMLTGDADKEAWWRSSPPAGEGTERDLTTDEPLRVLVAGGGLAGLVTAAACHSKGMKVALFEQALKLPGDDYDVRRVSAQNSPVGGAPVLRDLERVTFPSVLQRQTAHYNIACCRAKLGQSVEALDALETALSLGFDDFQLVQREGDFSAIRGDVDRLVARFKPKGLFKDVSFPEPRGAPGGLDQADAPSLFGVGLPTLPNPFGGEKKKQSAPSLPSMPSLPNPFGGLMDGIKKGIDQLDDIVDLKDDDQKKRRR